MGHAGYWQMTDCKFCIRSDLHGLLAASASFPPRPSVPWRSACCLASVVYSASRLPTRQQLHNHMNTRIHLATKVANQDM